MQLRLTLTTRQHADLHAHLFPGDGLEAAAIAVCGRARGRDRQRLIVHRVHPVPYHQCQRRADQITWKTDTMLPLIEEAARRGMAVLKVHSHPGGYPRFSEQDNRADREIFNSVYGWFEDELPHASAIMMSDGRMIARVVTPDSSFVTIPLVNCVGDNLEFWFNDNVTTAIPEHAVRSVQAFGEGTYRTMRRLRFAIIGASGTGSLVIEEIVRSHGGSLLPIDPDKVERKNLNRILNTTMKHAASGMAKVECLADAAREIGFDIEVIPITASLEDPAVIREVSVCDVVFGCMDSIDGRALLNRLATFYSLPYIDVGVRLDADNKGSIEQICGAIHYFQPGRSSFFTRGVFTPDDVFAAAMKRNDPEQYKKRVKQKYIRGVQEDRPAVMPVNMVFAGLAVMEFFARIHPFRIDPNSEYAYTILGLSQGIYDHGPEAKDCPSLMHYVGRGDAVPLLDMPDFTEISKAA